MLREIASASAEQLPELLAFAALSNDAPHWPTAAWQSFLEPTPANTDVQRQLFVLRQQVDITGVIAVALLGDTTELELLLVKPSSRRAGIGSALTAYWLRWAVAGGAREAVLEVRASNVPAQELYRSFGFTKQGLRPRYYSDPPENALLLHCALANNSWMPSRSVSSPDTNAPGRGDSSA